MFTKGIYPIGDGLLDIDDDRLKGVLVLDDINEIYDVEQTPFARGKFAAVRRAIHKSSGIHFAAKFLKRRRRAQSSDKEIKHEIAVLMLCDGAENIVKLNAVHESRSDTALLLELATGGELQTFLDNEECLSETQARICMREVLKALQFLHQRSIAHLDLKPQNILLCGERIEDGLKLCDFGISRVVAEGTNVREILGTPDYVAPEVLQYEPLSLLTDIWSVGVLAYVLLSGFSPFGGDTKQETFLNISQCALTFPDKLFGGVSEAALDFIRRALRIKPNDRMTAAGCLEHFWLKDDCSIDRQFFSNISKQTASDDDDDEDDKNGEDLDDDDDADSSNDDVNGLHGSKMNSTDAKQQSQQILSNGKAFSNINSTTAATNGTATKCFVTKSPIVVAAAREEYSPCAINIKTPTTINSTTISQQQHCNSGGVTATPQQQQQQQQLHIGARRHSSDRNKENNCTTRKMLCEIKIIIKPAANELSPSARNRSATPTTTTTITPTTGSQTTTTLPNCSSSSISNEKKNAPTECLFPDAPTTPKVIRKTPTADATPTSVKALVKKFQLEGSGSTSSSNSIYLNAKEEATINFNHSAAINNSIKSTIRRGSEPLTAVHKKSFDSTLTAASTGAATATTADNSYKKTCVFCLTCGGNNGCRHSTMSAANDSNSSSHHLQKQQHQHQVHLHNHHHHHNVVAKSATNSLSLEQGIIC